MLIFFFLFFFSREKEKSCSRFSFSVSGLGFSLKTVSFFFTTTFWIVVNLLIAERVGLIYFTPVDLLLGLLLRKFTIMLGHSWNFVTNSKIQEYRKCTFLPYSDQRKSLFMSKSITLLCSILTRQIRFFYKHFYESKYCRKTKFRFF